jgi:hypothetical protein
MATNVNKISSNDVDISYAEEDSIKTLGTPTWYGLQANTVTDFGGNITKTPRAFLTSDRQRRKGQTTNLESAGAINHDLVQEGLQRLMQGFFFADLRYKAETGGMGDSGVITAVGAANDYTRTVGSFVTDGYKTGDIVLGKGFTNSANNGIKTVLTVAALTLTVNETLVAEASPPAAAQLTTVGFEFATGDLDVDNSGDLPVLTSVSKTCTELGLVPGEFIYVGGDSASENFTNAANAGFARVRSVTANAITLDKTEATFITEADTTQNVRVFFGRVLKNETGTDIVRRTYNIERKLGVPDTAIPANIQSEYITGAVPSECTWQIPTADLAKMDMSWIALDHELRTGVTGVKAGTRVAAVEEEAYNTSSNVPRVKISTVSATDAAPTALFAFAEEITIVINNNIQPDMAIGVLGGFDATHGMFEVSGNMTAYFADVDAVSAVRNNSDVSLEMHLVRNNAGITLDLPLLSLGDGRLTVEQDEPIKLPLTHDAATGASIDTGLDHTLLMVYWDYLPDAAE